MYGRIRVKLAQCVMICSQAVTELLKLAPSTAVLLTRDESGHTTAEEEVPVDLVQQGDFLKVWRTTTPWPCQHGLLRWLTRDEPDCNL